MAGKKKLKHETKRTLIQLAAAAFFNGYAAGFVKGSIFQGKTKILCTGSASMCSA